MSAPQRFAAEPVPAARHRPNILFLVSGLVLILAGTGVMILGILVAAQAVGSIGGPSFSDLGAGPGARHDLEPLANGFALAAGGCVVMTIGRYVWRGARRRGLRDRLGRLLIIIGYLAVGAALFVLTRYILAAMAVDDIGESEHVLIRGLILCSAITIPGSLLALAGFRLAEEKPLMKAGVKAKL